MKLGLGTVQFGLDYGISNQGGKSPASEVRSILQLAARSGMQVLDTAPAYGSSERTLGEALWARHPFRIVTKTPSSDARIPMQDWLASIEPTLRGSLARLRQDSLYAVLVHHAGDLLGPGGGALWSTLEHLKSDGLIKQIGTSVYTPKETEEIVKRFPVELVQLPINVFNQEFLRCGLLTRLKEAGIEIHARSVFLQGLLLMLPESLPEPLSHLRDHLRRFCESVRERRMTSTQVALGFVLGLDEIDTVLCGVNDAAQLEELIAAAGCANTPDLRGFAVDDPEIVNPANWRLD